MTDDTRACAHCGGEFTTPYGTKLYCADSCAGKASRARRRARQGQQAPTSRKDCKGCGRVLSGRRTKWCSQKCRDHWRLHNDPGYRESVNDRRKKNSRKEWADEEFREEKKRKDAERYERTQGPIPNCIHCGQPKAARRGESCNRPECQATQRELRREEAKNNYPACSVDGCDDPGFKGRGMCASHYGEFWRIEYKETARMLGAKYRAALRTNRVENVYRDRVLARDKWICHLCGDKIPSEPQWPDPLSASLDHIIPISRGGEHSYRNIAAAHLRCNMRKGNRLAGERFSLA